MASDVDLILNRLASIPDVGHKLGVFVGMAGALAQVNVGDRVVSIPCSGFYPPVAGMSVQLERRNGSLIVTGPAQQLDPLGIITAGGSPKCVVMVGGTEYTLGYRAGYTPAPGDDVEINWATGIIQGKVTALAEVVRPAPNPVVDVAQSFTNLTVQAGDSGSYIGRWWTSDVYNGDSNTGAWFYGTGVRDSLRGATVTKVEIFLPARRTGGNAPRVGVHSSSYKPGGNVSVSAQVSLEPRNGWVRLPLSFVATLKSGGGIGVTPSGYNIWRGKSSDAYSGALRFSGTR